MKTLYRLGTQSELRSWSVSRNKTSLYFQWGSDSSGFTDHTVDYPDEGTAITEMRRKIRHKIEREGFTESIPKKHPLRPMLLHDYRDHYHRLPDQVVVQPKLNGIRCFASNDFLLTRGGVYISSLPQITKSLSALPSGTILDGELYCPFLSLQQISGMIRSSEPTGEYELIRLYVFDVVRPDQIYVDRLCTVSEIASSYDYLGSIPYCGMNNDLASLETYMQVQVEAGYEGIVVKDPLGRYTPGLRSYSAQKLKPVQTDQFQIVDVVGGRPGKDQHCGVFVLRSSSGTFEARPVGTASLRRTYLRNKFDYIGRWATIEYSEYTDSGLPSHARVTSLADYKKSRT